MDLGSDGLSFESLGFLGILIPSRLCTISIQQFADGVIAEGLGGVLEAFRQQRELDFLPSSVEA